MEPDAKRLLERWILTFLEPPPIIDVDLMRQVLDAHEREQSRTRQ